MEAEDRREHTAFTHAARHGTKKTSLLVQLSKPRCHDESCGLCGRQQQRAVALFSGVERLHRSQLPTLVIDQDDRRMPVIGDDLILRPSTSARNSACTRDHDQFSLTGLIDAPTVYLQKCCGLPFTARPPCRSSWSAFRDAAGIRQHMIQLPRAPALQSALLGGIARRSRATN